MKDIWVKRSETYNQLQWVRSRVYLDAFVKAGTFRKTDLVLDIGTGTGVVAHAIAPLVDQVIGLDKSQEMLEHSNWSGNMYFIKRDVLNPVFDKEVFDKVTARLVFHHILDGTQKAMDECYRVLKREGVMILSEGIPPCLKVRQDYIDIFKLKEDRLTFMEEDLISLMELSGFRNIKLNILWLRQMSVRNWLKNSGLSQPTQDKIYNLHKYAKDYFKRAYNMAETEGDCLIDMKMAVLRGVK